MNDKDLGEFISEHESISTNMTRGIIFTVVPLVVGTAATVFFMNQGKGNPWVSFAFGAFATGCGTLWGAFYLFHAISHQGMTVKLFENGLVVARGAKQQAVLFSDVVDIDEHIEAQQFAANMTTTHTLHLKPASGKTVKLAGSSLANFMPLRNAIIAGLTEALVPQIADQIRNGKNRQVKFVLLSSEGVLLEKTQKARGELIPWSDLMDVDVERGSGHVLIQTTNGTVDTGVWMAGIPLWFILPALAEEMRR